MVNLKNNESSNLKYFNFRKILKEFNIPFVKNKVFAFLTIRNTGKTTDVFDYILNEHILTGEKFLYVRNTDTQLIKAKADFNSYYSKKFICIGFQVFTLVLKKGAKGDKSTDYLPDELIGWFAALNIESTYKSIRAQGLGFIFYDEYNEKQKTYMFGIYAKFLNLIKTFIRFSDVNIVMCGNKNDPNSQYHVNWNIEYLNNNEEDLFTNIDDFIYFFDIGTNRFKSLFKAEDVVYKLSRFDNNTKRYFDGGYLIKPEMDVINYEFKIHPSADFIYGIYFDEQLFFYGKFILNNEEKYFFISQEFLDFEKSEIPKVDYFSVNIIGGTNKYAKILEDDGKQELLKFLYNKFKNGDMYFSSFDDKQMFILILRMVKL